MEIEKELTTVEFDMLIDAIDAWVDKDFGGQIMIDMLSMALIPKDAPEEVKAKMESDRVNDKRKYEEKKRLRKEQGIMLKAKLLKIRDSICASSI